MVDDRLIVVWHKDRNIHIWDAMESGYLQVVETNQPGARDLKISGDGSKAFLLTKRFIQVWFMWTGETVGQVELEDDSCPNFLCMGGSRVCVYFPSSMTLGWDFGMSGPSPVLLPDTSLERPCPDFIVLAGGTKVYPGLMIQVLGERFVSCLGNMQDQMRCSVMVNIWLLIMSLERC
jgi:hypothetical protein